MHHCFFYRRVCLQAAASPLEYAPAPVPMQRTRIAIPHDATQDGRLSLSCSQPPGLSGNGRTCEISEVLLTIEGSDADLRAAADQKLDDLVAELRGANQ